MDMHIGKLIKDKVQENQISVVKFASIINTTRENVYGIFKRKSIDTELLIKISKALNFNFFELFYSEINVQLGLKVHEQVVMKTDKTNSNEFDYLRNENELLRDIIKLLKEKKAK